MDKDIKIGIVGGGIGGLTTALCLEHFGFHNYIVYEQAPAFEEVGAAVSLWPNALYVYQQIGLYEQLSTQWGEIKAAYVKTDTGKVLSETIPQYDLPLVCIHRADLLNTLLSCVTAHKLRSDHRLQEVQLGQQQSKLIFDQGHEATVDVVIGADGIHSKVRQQLINDGPPIFRGYNVWRGIAELENVPTGYTSETWGKGSRIGIVPIKDHKFGWWATLNEGEDQPDGPQGAQEKLLEAFGDWHHPIPQLFEKSPKIIKNKVGDRVPITSWYHANAVLIGDAAHPTTPNLGQGACMAIEGAFLLSKCLDQLDSMQEAFQAYQNLHLKRTTEIVKQSLQSGKIGQLENQMAIKARNAVISHMPRKIVMRMMDRFFGYNVTQVKVS
ncbi:MAG: FAD-dependent monooxygenase [Bacteroidota bacterium]